MLVQMEPTSTIPSAAVGPAFEFLSKLERSDEVRRSSKDSMATPGKLLTFS
jgi:hypothetical protein